MNNESGNKDLFSNILSIIFCIYLCSTQIMSIYFWWYMMKEDNFFVGIFIDPFIAEFKGFLWPFFI